MIYYYLINLGNIWKAKIMYIFISHSSKNASTAEDICALIENNGHECFLAPRNIRSGHEYAEEIINGIDRSDVMLLILSEESNSSPHVIREIERAVSKKIPVIVYKLEDVELSRSMEYFIMTNQWVSAKPNIDHSEVLRCINELAGSDGDTYAAPAAPVSTESKEKKKISTKTLITTSVLFAAGLIIGLGCWAIVKIATSTMDALADAGGFEVEIDGANGDNISVSFGNSETSGNTSDVVLEDNLDEVLLGETLTFGTYNAEPIDWRVISISEDGASAVIMAERILTMKCYDAAEGGAYNSYDGQSYWSVNSTELDVELDRLLRGDNRWEGSNIRAWLNSDKDSVVYTGQAPNALAMSEKTNGYNNEPGFLRGFTSDELSAILTTDITTNGIVTEDRVYLLSSEELTLLEEADISRFATPTDKARELDTSKWYELQINEYGANDHSWWLRDADGITGSGVNVVTFSYEGGNVLSQPAGLEGYGVRPVMTIDLTSDYIKTKYLVQE